MTTSTDLFGIFTDEVPSWPPLACPREYFIHLPADRVYSATDYVNNKPFTPTPTPVKPDTSYTGADYGNNVPYPKE